MTHHEYVLLGITLFFFMLVWVGFLYIKHLRKSRHNTELWGTVFEGVTHKLIDLDAVKEPEVFIEKKSKRSGQEIDDEPADHASENSPKNQ
ncbi:MAG TPA: hypothetical protein VN030_12495 [Cellvibrio sp.]|nr:hypothetical protein [Cellvibrio sp.]